MTKTIYALSAIAMLAGSTAALAAPANTKNAIERANARAAFAQAPAGNTVVVDGKTIGRDPDFNVRLQLLRNYGSWNR